MEPVQRTKLTVQFAVGAAPWNPDNLELPVEVRRVDSVLVGRTLATGSLDVGPGSYVVRAAAVGGEFAGSIEVPPGQAEASVLLRFYDQAKRDFEPTAGTDAEGAARATFDLLNGHLLSGRALLPTQASEPDAQGLMRARSNAGSAVLRARSTSGLGCLIASLPESVAAHVAWEDTSDDQRLDMAFRFDHPQAQLLLSYLQKNAIADAQIAAHSTTLTAAQLLRGKKWDPLAGALGAYVLLRETKAGSPLTQELVQRSEQLWKYNCTFPDAWCIRAECRARSGDHRTALDTLLPLHELGLPFFSAGLSIAGLRLAEYLEPDAPMALDESTRQQAIQLLRRLRWLGLHALPAEPILKLANFDPGDVLQYQAFWQATGG